MTTWQEEQKAFSDQLFNNAPAFAAELKALDPDCSDWTIVGDRVREGEALTSLRMVRAVDGMAIWLSVDRHAKKIDCMSSVPLYPKLSGESGSTLSDFVSRTERAAVGIGDAPTGSVSLARYVGQTKAAARDLHRRVVAPYATVYPIVVARVADIKAAIKRQTDTAARIAAAHGGTVHNHRGGDTLYVGLPGSLPSLEVRNGGYIRTSHPLDIPESVLGALIAALQKKPQS